jgi:NitT/TauT family transport system substrate-binding protein
LALVMAMLSMMGLAGWAGWRAMRPQRAELRVAINPWPGYEFATLAREKGYFRDEGVAVRLLDLSSLGDCVRAFERGQADGFFGTVTEVLRSREQSSRGAKVVLAADYSEGADVIMAVPSIATVADLKGARVGIESGSMTAYMLARALEKHGLAWNDVETVHMAALDMADAIASGKVEAVVTYPPLSVDISRRGNAKEIFTSREIPGEVVDVLAFDEQTVADRAEAIRGFIRAFHRAQDYAKANPEEAWRIMAARERITPEEFRDSITNGVRVLQRADQPEFIGEGGRLQRLMLDTDRLLRRIGQLKGPAGADDSIAVVGDD